MSARLAFRLVLLGGLLAAAVWAVTLRDRIDPTAIEALVAAAGVWGVALFILAFAVATVLFLPGTVFALAGGALFGPLAGTVVNLAGATLGAVLAFLAARYLAADWVSRRAGPRLTRLVEGVEAEGWRFVAFVRLVPLFPFNLLNYALGLTRIRLGTYTLTTAVCMIPGALAYTSMGHAGREALAGGESAVQSGLLALGLLAVALFLPRLVSRLRRGKRLTVSQLRERMEEDDDLLVLDLRDAADLDGELGRIDGIVNIPLPDLEARLAELDGRRDRPVAVLCRTDRRSKKAVSLLTAQGFADVHLVEGGMVAWNAAGFPVSHEGAIT